MDESLAVSLAAGQSKNYKKTGWYVSYKIINSVFQNKYVFAQL